MRKNVKHEKFVHAYLKGNNATQAAIMAGYSKKNAKAQGYKLLHRDDIDKLIKEHMDDTKSENVADEKEILMFYTNVLRNKTVDTVVTPTGKAIKIKPRLQDRIKAGEMLGKNLALWTDKKQVDANVTPMIIDDVVEEESDDG